MRLNAGLSLSGRWILLVLTSAVRPYHADPCPTNTTASVQQCFQTYTHHMGAIDTTHFFTGIDVELIRSACTALFTSVGCAKTYMDSCKAGDTGNIDVMTEAYDMFQLCNYPNIYDIYARHMSCYSLSAHSQQCYDKFRAQIEPLEDRMEADHTQALVEMCNELDRFVDCVETNVRLQCSSDEAGSLVRILIMPSVHQSSKCSSEDVASHQSRLPEKPTDPTNAQEQMSGASDHVCACYAVVLLTLSFAFILTV